MKMAITRRLRSHFNLYLTLITLAFSGVGNAQQWQTFTRQDGLANNEVSVVTQASDGALWFATRDGANRYDGITWQTFAASGLSSCLNCNGALDVLETANGDIWFAGGFGASRYNGEAWENISITDKPEFVTAMYQAADGSLWFGFIAVTDQNPRGRAARFDGEQWTIFSVEDGFDAEFTFEITQTDEGALLFATNNTQTVSTNEDGGLSFNDNAKLLRYDGTAWSAVEIQPDPSIKPLSVFQADNGDLWFGSPSGAIRFDGETWKIFTTEDGLVDNFVRRIIQADDGTLWFVSQNTGISRFDGETWLTYTAADGLASNLVTDITQSADGALWLTTQDNGISRFDPLTWQNLTAQGDVAAGEASDIEIDLDGNLWFATSSGASRFDSETWRTFTIADGLALDAISNIEVDHQDNLWFNATS